MQDGSPSRSEGTAQVTEAPAAVLAMLGPVKPKPSQCRQFVRRRLAEALPAICSRLVEKCIKGDTAALKLLWQLGELGEGPAAAGSPARKGTARRGFGELRRQQLQFARETLAAFHAREGGSSPAEHAQ